MKFNAFILIPTFLGLTLVQAQQKNTGILPNENLITENIAAIPKDLAVQVKKYSEARGASLAEIHPIKNDIIITTRFGSTAQLHRVVQPLGARTRVT